MKILLTYNPPRYFSIRCLLEAFAHMNLVTNSHSLDKIRVFPDYKGLSNSYTMGCPLVRGDNLRA